MQTSRHLTLFVRSLAPEGTGDEQAAVVESLQQLRDKGAIADFSVEVWGQAVTKDSPLAATETGESVLERVRAFEQWASISGVSTDRFIQRDEVHSELRETTQTVIRFPAMLIAEYVDGSLAYVTPHETDDGVVTVQDRLATLDSGHAEDE